MTTDYADPRSEERVSVYQDGVPISRTTGAAVALFDLDVAGSARRRPASCG